MAISSIGSVVTSAIFHPRDLRDPLGIWGMRLAVTGDASGGGITVVAQVAPELKAAYVYTCYSVNITIVDQAVGNDFLGSVRLLTNWPDIDPTAGVQAYSSHRVFTVSQAPTMTVPKGGIDRILMNASDRFILLYDPRPIGIAMDIVELQAAENVLSDTYSFECYGYFWDRQVMNTMGGLRHPGSD